MNRRLKILAIEPYSGLSHRAFLEGYQRHSSHEVKIWALPPRKWKWRMRGSAYHFASRAAQELSPDERTDVVLASDYLNLADWRALCPPALRQLPCALYFHENQLCYPLADHAPVEHHYAWINLSSALAADCVLFNSAYHRQLFLGEVERVLGRMPEPVPPDLAAGLWKKSSVFPVGIDFTRHEGFRTPRPITRTRPPLIVWNHRWEHDKAPERFVRGLLHLKNQGLEFRVVLLGESRDGAAMNGAASKLREHIEHAGFIAAADDYLRMLARCDIVVSTARHEFFGVSVVEAMYLGCLPVLPNALSYPEIVPPPLQSLVLYPEGRFEEFLASVVRKPPWSIVPRLQQVAERFHWKTLAPDLDARLASLVRPSG